MRPGCDVPKQFLDFPLWRAWLIPHYPVPHNIPTECPERSLTVRHTALQHCSFNPKAVRRSLLHKAEALVVTWEWPSWSVLGVLVAVTPNGQGTCTYINIMWGYHKTWDWKLESGKKVAVRLRRCQIQQFLLATCQTGNVAKTIKATKEDLKRDNG